MSEPGALGWRISVRDLRFPRSWPAGGRYLLLSVGLAFFFISGGGEVMVSSHAGSCWSVGDTVYGYVIIRFRIWL